MSKPTASAAKILLSYLLLLLASRAPAQNLQLHYDLRHTLAPAANRANFPSFSFEYFKNLDTLGHGSFFFKMQADLTSRHHNVGQVYTQLTQTFRFWKPGVLVSLNYNGGLGITPDGYGFYLANALGVGLAYPFQWRGAWFSATVLGRCTAFERPSYDPQVTLYFGRGFFRYKLLVAGTLGAWTQNRNQGNPYTAGLSGKKTAFFGDPQVWLSVKKGWAVGTRLNAYYHLLSEDATVQLYPTLGTKYQF